MHRSDAYSSTSYSREIWWLRSPEICRMVCTAILQFFSVFQFAEKSFSVDPSSFQNVFKRKYFLSILPQNWARYQCEMEELEQRNRVIFYRKSPDILPNHSELNNTPRSTRQNNLYFQSGKNTSILYRISLFEWKNASPGLLIGELVGLMTWWLWVVANFFLSGVFSPLTSAEALEKSSR